MIAQLAEHQICNLDVSGSNPDHQRESATDKKLKAQRSKLRFSEGELSELKAAWKPVISLALGETRGMRSFTGAFAGRRLLFGGL